ncbi:MAG: GIY-YIG nuclease family protein [bacterium]
MKKKKNWSVYIVRCKDNTLYTGISNNISHRLEAHNNGKGAKYINSARRPVKLMFVEEGYNVSGALKREYEIKRSGKIAKEKLIKVKTKAVKKRKKI